MKINGLLPAGIYWCQPGYIRKYIPAAYVVKVVIMSYEQWILSITNEESSDLNLHLLFSNIGLSVAEEGAYLLHLLALCNYSTGNKNPRNINHQTPLHITVLHGHLKALQTLLRFGPDVETDAADNLRQTPLHLTSSLGDKNAMALLIAAGEYCKLVDLSWEGWEEAKM